MTSAVVDREPIYFGPPTEPLFGCYHASRPGTDRRCGVVLCYPMGQEYIRAHRAFMQLSVRVARTGLPSLRFDFYGCGDSSGEHEEARIARWLNNVGTACAEMRRRNRAIEKIGLMGLRMGAALSVLAAAKVGEVEFLALWNPVVDGSAHLKELENMHREMLRFSYVDPEPNGSVETSAEIMGFPFSRALLSDIGAIDLLTIRQKPANQVLLLDSARDRRVEELGCHLENLGTRVRLHRFDGPRLWLEEPYRAVVPHEVWNCAVEWLSEVGP